MPPTVSNFIAMLKKIFRVTLILIVVVGIAVFSTLNWGTYSEGIRSGNVVKVSKKGFIFKTVEGQLNLQTFGAVKGTPISESFEFSVDPDETEIVSELEKVSLSGERVSLHYVERYVRFPWKGDTKYFIVKVERLE